MRRDHVGVELGGGVEVVVVVVEAGVSQLFSLTILEHAEGNASLHAQCLDLADHLQHRLQILFLRPAPGSTHAEAGSALGLGGLGGSNHVCHRHQLLALELSLVAG